MVRPSWRTSEVLPCMSFGARTTLPPKAWPRAWWPRQTPRSGTGERRTGAGVVPAVVGGPGPREEGAGGDAEAEPPAQADVAEGPAVEAAGRGLELVDDLHRADLRGAG